MSWDTAMALDLALARGGYECERCGDRAAPRPRSLCWPCKDAVAREDEEARIADYDEARRDTEDSLPTAQAREA